jgi:hypothetical protein
MSIAVSEAQLEVCHAQQLSIFNLLVSCLAFSDSRTAESGRGAKESFSDLLPEGCFWRSTNIFGDSLNGVGGSKKWHNHHPAKDGVMRAPIDGVLRFS